MSRSLNQTSRAIRRHHKERLKKKRQHYFTAAGSLHIVADTPCVCSCAMCSNKRKYSGEKTCQEDMNDLKYKEGLKEYGEE